MHLNPEQILSFVALAQQGSVSAAAHVRHLTQPAISNQLKRLQEAVGTPLYRRQGRGVILTATGEAFYPHALKAAQALRETDDFADALLGLSTGRIHVAASQTIAGSLLPSVLVKLRAESPEIEVFVDSGNSQQVFDSINTHELGLVESPLPGPIPGCCRIELLGQDEIVCVMPRRHPLTRQASLTLTDLTDYPLIWRESGSGTREVLEQALLKILGRLPEVHICLGGVAAVLEAVRQGLGIGVISRFSLPTGETAMTTRPFRPQLSRPMSMLIPAQASPLARRVASFLLEDLRSRLQSP